MEYDIEYEIGVNESVSTAVVHAVSVVDGRHPCTIPPLTHVLDPDALDALFNSTHGGEPRTGGRLSFIYNHCRVTVDNGEYLTVRLLDDSRRVTAARERDRTGL